MSRPPPDRGHELVRLPRFGGGYLALERRDYQGHPWYRLVSKKDELAEERTAVIKARELRRLGATLVAEADRLEVLSRAEGREAEGGRASSAPSPERSPARPPAQHRTQSPADFFAGRPPRPGARRG